MLECLTHSSKLNRNTHLMSQHCGYKLRKQIQRTGWARTPKNAPACGGLAGSVEAIQVTAALKVPRACVRAGGPGSSPSLHALTSLNSSQRVSSLQQTSRPRVALVSPPPSPAPALPEPMLPSCLFLTCTVPRVLHFTLTAPSLRSTLCPLLPPPLSLSPSFCLCFQRDESHLSCIRPHHLV